MGFSCGCSDGPEWHRETEQKARKSYTCCECGGEIAKGATYQYMIGRWDGDVSVFRTCEPCADLRESYAAQGYCYVYGRLWADHLDELQNSGRAVRPEQIEAARAKARASIYGT